MRRSATLTMLSALPWIGMFNIHVLSGTFENHWTMHHADSGACDVSVDGQGSESGTIGAGNRVLVPLTGAGPSAFLMPAAGLDANAIIDREGSLTYGADDGDDTDGCPSGGDGEQPPAPDCGIQTVPLTFAFTPNTVPDLSASSVGDSPWKNCPVEGATLPAVPDTMAGPSILSGVGPLPDPPDTTFHVVGTSQQSDGDVDATVKLDVELRVERVTAFETVVLPDSYKTAPVDGSGTTKIPVSCPAGATCKGTVGIAVGGFASGRDATPPKWPKPVQQSEPLLGGARFSLKGGRSARIAVRLAHGSTQALKGLAGEKLDVIVRQVGKGRAKPVAYVAGQVKLRVR